MKRVTELNLYIMRAQPGSQNEGKRDKVQFILLSTRRAAQSCTFWLWWRGYAGQPGIKKLQWNYNNGGWQYKSKDNELCYSLKQIAAISLCRIPNLNLKIYISSILF